MTISSDNNQLFSNKMFKSNLYRYDMFGSKGPIEPSMQNLNRFSFLCNDNLVRFGYHNVAHNH